MPSRASIPAETSVRRTALKHDVKRSRRNPVVKTAHMTKASSKMQEEAVFAALAGSFDNIETRFDRMISVLEKPDTQFSDAEDA